MYHRRLLYMELNRPMYIEVYLPDGEGYLDEVEFISDYFVLSVPEAGSIYDVWLIKTFNHSYEIQGWVQITEDSLDAMELDSHMHATQIAHQLDYYQRGWLDYDDEDYDEISGD